MTGLNNILSSVYDDQLRKLRLRLWYEEQKSSRFFGFKKPQPTIVPIVFKIIQTEQKDPKTKETITIRKNNLSSLKKLIPYLSNKDKINDVIDLNSSFQLHLNDDLKTDSSVNGKLFFNELGKVVTGAEMLEFSKSLIPNKKGNVYKHAVVSIPEKDDDEMKSLHQAVDEALTNHIAVKGFNYYYTFHNDNGNNHCHVIFLTNHNGNTPHFDRENMRSFRINIAETMNALDPNNNRNKRFIGAKKVETEVENLYGNLIWVKKIQKEHGLAFAHLYYFRQQQKLLKKNEAQLLLKNDPKLVGSYYSECQTNQKLLEKGLNLTYIRNFHNLDKEGSEIQEADLQQYDLSRSNRKLANKFAVLYGETGSMLYYSIMRLQHDDLKKSLIVRLFNCDDKKALKQIQIKAYKQLAIDKKNKTQGVSL